MSRPGLDQLIVADPARMGGAPCFRGTRVPVSVVFENLADGLPLADILANWPTLDRSDVIAVLEQTPRAPRYPVTPDKSPRRGDAIRGLSQD